MKVFAALVCAFCLGGAFGFIFIQSAAFAQSETDDESGEKAVCCIDFSAKPLGFMPRSECSEKYGDVAPPERCEAEGAVAERADAANVQGARDIGDIPALSPDSPTQNWSCAGGSCACEEDSSDSSTIGSCDGVEEACRDHGATIIECTTIYVGKERTHFCNCEY